MENLFLYLGIYLVLLLGISFWIAKRNSDEDFLIAGRNRKKWQLLFSQYSGATSVGWFITFAAFAYQFGISTLSVGIGLAVSYLIFALWAAPRVHKDSKENKFYTQGDFVLNKTGSASSKKLVDGVSIFNSLIQILVGFVGGANLISFLSPISYESALILTASIILIYIVASGYKAVILTDVVQSVVILLFLLLSVSFLFNTESLGSILSIETGTMGIGTIIGFLVFGIFSVFGRSERYQLCFSADTSKSLKKGFSLAVIPVIFTMTLVVIIGMYMYGQNPNIDPGLSFIQFFVQSLPQGFIGIGAIIMFAALMGSADTDIYAASSYASFLEKRKNHILNTRILTFIVIFIATLIGFFFRDMVAIGVLAGITLVTTSIAMIYIIAGGKNHKKFIASIVTAIIFCVISVILLGIQPTVLAPTVLGGAIGLLYPLKNPFKKKGVLKNEIHP